MRLHTHAFHFVCYLALCVMAGESNGGAVDGDDPLKHFSSLLFPMQPKICCFVLS